MHDIWVQPKSFSTEDLEILSLEELKKLAHQECLMLDGIEPEGLKSFVDEQVIEADVRKITKDRLIRKIQRAFE
jgi:hypothetical protein